MTSPPDTRIPQKSHLVRISAPVRRALEALAARDRRSVTAEIAFILENYIDQEEGWLES